MVVPASVCVAFVDIVIVVVVFETTVVPAEILEGLSKSSTNAPIST